MLKSELGYGPCCRRLRGSPGFSLLEALVVLVIILLLAIIGLPNFLGVMKKIRLESAATDIANVMNQTRLRAIRDNTSYTVSIQAGEVVGKGGYGSGELTPGVVEATEIRATPQQPVSIYKPGDGAADCLDKYDGSGDFFGGDSVTYEGTGVSTDSAAICVHDGQGNILQVVVPYTTTQPKIRKYLQAGADSPSGDAGFFEKTGANPTTGKANIWVWY